MLQIIGTRLIWQKSGLLGGVGIQGRRGPDLIPPRVIGRVGGGIQGRRGGSGREAHRGRHGETEARLCGCVLCLDPDDL